MSVSPRLLMIYRRRHAISYMLRHPALRLCYVCGTRSNRGRDIYWRLAITEATICHAAVLIT